MGKEHERGRTLVWVHPLFAKKIKMDAAIEGKSMLKHTEEIGKAHSEYLDDLKNRKNEKKKFNFGI